MARRMAGIIVGLIVSMAAISLFELIGQRLFPPPAGIDMSDPAQIGRAVDAIPIALKLSVIGAWFGGALAGGWTGLRVARWGAVPWIVAGGVVLGAVISFTQIPHPWWMQVAGVTLPLLAAWIAGRIGRS